MSSIASADSPRRNLQLDILRGVAILLVLLCHSIHLRQPTWDMVVWRAGWSGVDLFFVVSGFLISGLLFGEYRKTGRIRFRRFAIRRAIKIYPAFYALVLVTVAITLLRDPFWIRDEIWPRLFHDVVFIQSYFQGTWGHFWSLSVEEHFYILLPLTMFFLIRAAGERRSVDPFTAIPKLFVVVAMVLLIARLLTARYVPYSWQTHLFPTHLRLDSLFFGVVIAYWYHFHRERFTCSSNVSPFSTWVRSWWVSSPPNWLSFPRFAFASIYFRLAPPVSPSCRYSRQPAQDKKRDSFGGSLSGVQVL